MKTKRCLDSKPVNEFKEGTLAYIADLVEQMETLAAHEGIEPLHSILRLAREEAQRKARQSRKFGLRLKPVTH